MKYIVNTVWKHDNTIKWEKMQEAMDQLNKEVSPAEEVFWFAIDENTHGVVSVFPSEESFREYKEKLNEMRKESSSEMNISMTFEARGLARVTKTGA